jgi:FtsZ-interacting cell division protein ZipA
VEHHKEYVDMIALYITLVIVGGIVIVALAGIAWLWWTTARGISSAPFGRRVERSASRLDELEKQVQTLRSDVDELKNRSSS